jgi:hypothetical protein
MKNEVLIAIVTIAGTIFGSLSSILTIIVQRNIHSKSDHARKKILRKMLSTKKWKWRDIDSLCKVIGTNEEKAKELLLEIGARASEDEKEIWGLIKRNPFN